MAGPQPRRRQAPAERPTAGPTPAPQGKAKLTKGQRAAQRAERQKERKAHRAGMRAVWRERWLRFLTWMWPDRTRDVGKGKAILVLVLNVAPLPGLGTVLYGQWERGLLQFLLTFLFLVGWVWAILDGVRIVHRAFHEDPRRQPLPRRV